MTENIDTYVTTEEADDFVSEMYPSTHPLRVTWEVLTESEKERYLSVALTRMEQLNYIGRRVNFWQPLKFPRIANGLPAEFDKTPIDVKRAQTAWATDIAREVLYVGKRNNIACTALGIISDSQAEADKEMIGTIVPPPKVKEILYRWLTNWRKI